MAGNSEQVVLAHDDDEVDFETASMESDCSKELQSKKSMRRFHCVAVIVLLLTVMVIVISTTFFHVNAPTFRIRSITIDELRMMSSSNTIDIKFEAQIGIKNTNFGHFDFEDTSISFFYRGVHVALDGDGDHELIEKGKVRARSTKKINFSAEIGTTNSISIDDIECRCLTLTCKATMNGTIHLMKLIKRRRSSEMNCTINIDLYKKAVFDIKCK
ncbi:late embryogenesis abundant protein At1g64065-like [Humulus lupulus]|uniref:late embryogenesis abundant protein At1g64065-like n=1 Tax=Humulus lupulus TaxID=3486 RepID=UPI002B416C78|nr:late embryogenesis abundant protein At1g64065-like [Humulus lupulus]